MKAAAKVGSFADVGLGLGVAAAEQKYGWCRGDGGEEFRVAIWAEFEALGQHEIIVSKIFTPETRGKFLATDSRGSLRIRQQKS
jgi:hypothetical protein